MSITTVPAVPITITGTVTTEDKNLIERSEELLIQLKINNEYNKIKTDENYTEEDIEE